MIIDGRKMIQCPFGYGINWKNDGDGKFRYASSDVKDDIAIAGHSDACITYCKYHGRVIKEYPDYSEKFVCKRDFKEKLKELKKL